MILAAAIVGLTTSSADVVVSSKRVYDVTHLTYGANTPNYINHKFMVAAGDAMINATGVSHFRWPGGNYANQLFWNNEYDRCPYFAKYANKNAESWVWTWAQAAAFAKARAIPVLWQMNAAVGGVCGVGVAADLAAAFVANATAAGFPVELIEVGNENYGKWETPYADKPEAVNASIYAATCVAVSKAVKAQDPTIKVGCVGDVVDPAHPNTPFPDWQADVLAGAERWMDFLIIHEYYAKSSSALPEDLTPWGLLNYGCVSAAAAGGPNCGPAAVANAVKAAASGPLAVMITEYNMLQPFGPPTWQLVQGLFAAKHLGESMAAGILGSTFFALANGQSPDYGMFSRDTSAQLAYAPVFTFAIFTRVAPVGSAMLALTLDVQALNVTAFAFAHEQPGSYGIVLVNMGAAARSVSLEGPWGAAAALSAATYSLTAAPGSGADDPFSATAFAYNGVAGAAKGGPFPAAGLDSMPPKHGTFTGTVDLAPASVTGIVLQ